MAGDPSTETLLAPGARWRDVWAEVDLAAITHNVQVIRNHLRACAEARGGARPSAGACGHPGSIPKLMAVVKADAYGHGAVPVARAALAAGADWLGVATLGEAVELREAGIRAPILVLGHVSARHAGIAAAADVTLTVASVEHARELSDAVLTTPPPRPLHVHLKLDSGMSRIGVRTVGEIQAVADLLPRAGEASGGAGTGPAFADGAERPQNTRSGRGGTPPGEAAIAVTGAFTHFARADEADAAPARSQWARAQVLFDAVKSLWPGPLLLHAANSAAILTLPEAHLDMVRLGISLYGVYPSAEVAQAMQTVAPLRQAMRLYARVAQVKRVPAGTPVSYGGTHVTAGPATLATLPIGYADGLLRVLSNRGFVHIRGVRCPIAGRVCMDQVVVDATGVPDVREGDVATVYDEGSLVELAHLAGTIPYELLCAISRRVPRLHRPAEGLAR